MDQLHFLLLFVALGLLAAVFYSYRQLAKSNRQLHHELQTLRYELNTKTNRIEEEAYFQSAGTETTVYDGRNGIGETDFSGNVARTWDYVAHRFNEGYGKGSHLLQGGVITVNRTNTAGRYELYLKRFVFDGKTYETIPASTTQTARKMHLSCEVKKGPASHLLRFVFKGQNSKEVLDEKDYVVFSPDWEKIELFFTVQATEDCLFRIDDLSVIEAPSSIQIRNLVLFEKR